MEKSPVIYATNGDTVEMYNIKFSDQFRKVQERIDNWHGKGDLKAVTTTFLSTSEISDHLEVVSKKFLGKGEVFYSCCAECGETEFYEYQYYEYKPHPLSELCDSLLKDNKSLELSKNIRLLLDWTPQSEEEASLLKELLKTFELEKIELELSRNTTITHKRISYLNRILNLLKLKQEQETLYSASSDLYNEELNKRIRSIENINSLPIAECLEKIA